MLSVQSGTKSQVTKWCRFANAPIVMLFGANPLPVSAIASESRLYHSILHGLPHVAACAAAAIDKDGRVLTMNLDRSTGSIVMRIAPTLACGFILAGAPLVHGKSAVSPVQYSRRQLAGCMWKRMQANRRLSYNDAAKACDTQLRGTETDADLSQKHTRRPVS